MSTPRMELLMNLRPDSVVEYLRENGIIANEKTCVCRHKMSLQQSTRSIDGVNWRCGKCKKAVSVRRKTFMENSKLALSVIFQLVYDFVCETPVTSSMALNGIARESAIQWYECCREICTTKLLKGKVRLGGPDHEVQMHANLMLKRKIKCRKNILVVGFYDTTEKRGFVLHMPNKTSKTLESAIINNILPGTTILTNEWPNDNLARLGYIHGGVSTKIVRCYWMQMMRRVKSKSGAADDMRWSYVYEIMYRESYGMTSSKVISNFNTFLKHIADVYPQ